MSARRRPPVAEPEPAQAAWLVSPRVLLPVIGVLAAALIGLGVVYALDSGGGGGSELVIQSCVVGQDPNCKLRQPMHEHADFAVVIRGERIDFGQEQYISDEEEISPLAHVHNPRHTVVHVHMSGTTWAEFFTSLGYTLVDPSLIGITAEQTCLTLPSGETLCNTGTERLRFFVNGVEVDGISQTEIQDLDRVLVTYGDESDAEVQAQVAAVTDQACIPSERCIERIPPDEPPETCSGKGACAN